MKLKSLAVGALLAVSAFGASATEIFSPNVVTAPSFTQWFIGSITVTDTSNITGNIFAADTVHYGSLGLALDKVTFSSASVGSLVDLDSSAAGFSFGNVAAGVYNIYASGTLDYTPSSPVHGVAFLAANYSVTAVPEPETYGMMLGGMALLGVVARRKAKKSA